jgi:hypothetical protein
MTIREAAAKTMPGMLSSGLAPVRRSQTLRAPTYAARAKKARATNLIARPSASAAVRRPLTSVRSRQRRIVAEEASTTESSPNPTRATEPAARPKAIPATASSTL